MKDELNKLLVKLNQAYLESDNINNRFCFDNNRKWGYELILTACLEQEPMIIGFNWGVDNTWDEYINGRAYENQKDIEEVNFTKIHMGSLERVKPYMKKYFPEVNLNKGSHSNFCFFRSEKESQITEKDINLCIPIFNEMIEIVKPSVIICLSSRARDYFWSKNLFIDPKEKIIRYKTKTGKNRTVKAVKAHVGKSKIYCIPHPNSKISTEARKIAWQFVSEQ